MMMTTITRHGTVQVISMAGNLQNLSRVPRPIILILNSEFFFLQTLELPSRTIQ